MTIKFVYSILIVFLLLGNGGFMQGNSEAASDECIQVVNAIQFSNDPDKLLFRYHCARPNNPNFWAVYEFSSGRAYDFDVLHKATKNAIHDSPSYSRDGKLITFVAGQDNHRNIFVMNADGSNVRQLTHDNNENPKEVGKDLIEIRFNDTPSFSSDGRRIIFKRSDTKRTKPLFYTDAMRPSRWDIYEIDIQTGKKQRLTNYAFHIISQPYYLSDGKRFIFSAYLQTIPSEQESGIDSRTRGKYWNKYKDNTIFIMDGKNNALTPVLQNGRHSDEPQIGSDDMIIFRSRVNEIDKMPPGGPFFYDLFVYKNGRISRLVNAPLQGLHFSVSPDGTRAVLSYASYDSSHVELSVIDFDDKKRIAIRIPWHQLRTKTIQPGNK